MAATTQPTDASTTVKELAEGDVIRVPQYKSALQVTFVGDDGRFIGVEFVDESKQNSTQKSLIVSEGGLVYLIAGTSDKGEVKTIEQVVESEEGDDDDEDGDDDDGGLIEEPIEVDSDRLEVTRLESRATGKVVFEVVGTFSVNGEQREKGMVAHYDGELWVLEHHLHAGGFVTLARGESSEDVINKAHWVMCAYDC